jgi:hypothetical protein
MYLMYWMDWMYWMYWMYWMDWMDCSTSRNTRTSCDWMDWFGLDWIKWIGLDHQVKNRYEPIILRKLCHKISVILFSCPAGHRMRGHWGGGCSSQKVYLTLL